MWYKYQDEGRGQPGCRTVAPQHHLHFGVIDRFYKGAISQVEVEKSWGLGRRVEGGLVGCIRAEVPVMTKVP